MSDLSYDAAGKGDPALLFFHGWCGDRSFSPRSSTSSRTVIGSSRWTFLGTGQVPSQRSIRSRHLRARLPS